MVKIFEDKKLIEINSNFIFMTEGQIKMFKDMIKIYCNTLNIIYDNDLSCSNDVFTMCSVLEEITGQPVTDWI